MTCVNDPNNTAGPQCAANCSTSGGDPYQCYTFCDYGSCSDGPVCCPDASGAAVCCPAGVACIPVNGSACCANDQLCLNPSGGGCGCDSGHPVCVGASCLTNGEFASCITCVSIWAGCKAYCGVLGGGCAAGCDTAYYSCLSAIAPTIDPTTAATRCLPV
jgi:hypothetical protein